MPGTGYAGTLVLDFIASGVGEIKVHCVSRPPGAFFYGSLSKDTVNCPLLQQMRTELLQGLRLSLPSRPLGQAPPSWSSHWWESPQRYSITSIPSAEGQSWGMR